MANRIDDGEVREIMDVDTDISDLTPFITAANLIVTARLAGQGLGDTLMKEIERWLAAHFVASRDPLAKTEKIGDASITIQGEFGKNLESTAYGQRALLLDTTGALAKAGKIPVKFNAINFSVT